MNAVTSKELDAFYGVEATQYEINQAITAAKRGIDSDDLSDISYANANGMLAAIVDGDAIELLRIFQVAIKQSVADRASIGVYGRTGVIKAQEVTL